MKTERRLIVVAVMTEDEPFRYQLTVTSCLYLTVTKCEIHEFHAWNI